MTAPLAPRTVFALSLAALALWGCPHHQDAADGRISLRFSGYAGNPAETNLMQKLVGDFNKSQKDIQVSYEPVPGQYYPKLLTMLVSKTAPDVFYLDVLEFKPFLAKHVLKSLTPYLVNNAQLQQKDFLPSLWNAFKEGDDIYGIPKDFNTLALFYNTQMFDEAKLGYPDASWDLEKVRTTAKLLTRDKGPTGKPQYGFALMGDEIARYMPIAWSYGADLFKPDGNCALGSPEAVKALEWYTSFKLQDHSGIMPAEVGSSWPGDTFGRQDSAMVFEGGWLEPYLAETFPKVQYGVTELPPGPKGRSNLLFTVSYVIPESCPHPDAAWKLIEFLTSAESQAQITFALPSRTDIATKYVSEHPRYQPMLAGAAYARPYQFGAKGDRIKDRVGVAMQEVFLGVKSHKQALEDAAADVDQLLKL
jgi:multiple sugar transport system substrate-binding protein